MNKANTRKDSFSIFNMDDFPNLPDHYKVISLLGEGAFSLVYKGIDCRNGENVAIKIINKANLSKKQIENINNEISVMNTLNNAGNHQNVLRLIESYDFEQNSFLILEYCDGGEIFDKIIEHTYLSEELARHVFLQLLDSVSFLHENNVVHRDIKPENLLFKSIPKIDRSAEEYQACLRSSDDDSKVDEGCFYPGVGGGGIGVIKLADFGLAKQLRYDSSTSFGTFRSNLKTPCGTAGYTAPEVIHCGVERKRRFRSAHSRNNFYSKSVDIWSLGCFLYTSLCGFPPFYDDDNEVLSRKILNGDFVFLAPWWDEISSAAKDLISRMLVVSAKSRITLDEIYKHPWMRDCTPLKQESYFPQQSSQSQVKKEVDCVAPPKRIKSPVGMTGGLVSPKIAIKQVFDNPAMSYVSLQSLAQSKRDRSQEQREVQFDRRAHKDSKCTSQLPRTPNPIYKVNFGDVFGSNLALESQLSENAQFDSEDTCDDIDDISSEGFSDSQEESSFDEGSGDVGEKEILEFDDDSSVVHFSVREDHPIEASLKELSLSSTTSLDSGVIEDDASGIHSSSNTNGTSGEFEFTLKLNDSNLLRRRSSSRRK